MFFYSVLLCHYVLDALSYKLDILKKMNLDDVAAVLPLLQFSITKLRDFAALAEKESHEFPHGNRLKYTSEKLQVDICSICVGVSAIDISLIYSFSFLCCANFCSSVPWKMCVRSLRNINFYFISH